MVSINKILWVLELQRNAFQIKMNCMILIDPNSYMPEGFSWFKWRMVWWFRQSWNFSLFWLKLQVVSQRKLKEKVKIIDGYDSQFPMVWEIAYLGSTHKVSSLDCETVGLTCKTLGRACQTLSQWYICEQGSIEMNLTINKPFFTWGPFGMLQPVSFINQKVKKLVGPGGRLPGSLLYHCLYKKHEKWFNG